MSSQALERKFLRVLSGNKLGLWSVRVECVCLWWRKSVKGWDGRVCGQHWFFGHLFWHGLGSLPLLSGGADLWASSALTCSRVQGCAGIPSLQAVLLEARGMKRQHFLCKQLSQKGLSLWVGQFKPLPVSHSLVYLTHVCRDSSPGWEGACVTRPGPLVP